MDINPFENSIKKEKNNIPASPKNSSNISTKRSSDTTGRYKEFIQTKNEFYKQKFDILESQIEDFQRKTNREKYLSKFTEKESTYDTNVNKPTNNNDEIILQQDKIIINNKGNGCLSGCNPFSWLGNLKCCGCLSMLILVIGIYIFFIFNNRTIQDFTIENIIPTIIGNINTAQLPNPNYFSISDRFKSEIERIELSPNNIESFTIFESELNTYLLEQDFSIANYPTEQYITFDENKMNLYIKRKNKNDSWTSIQIQSDKLGKPQIIGIQYGKINISGELVRNFLNNLPLNIGNINFEKLDEKFSEILFSENNHKIDKVLFSKGKAELSIIRK